jgi:aspartate/methionine/tyrosine aminotransferase
MNKLLSERISRVKPSPTIAIADTARAMKESGLDAIALAQGEPDMDTPAHIREAGIKAIEQGLTRYTAVTGTPDLRQAIADKLKRDHGGGVTTTITLARPCGIWASIGLAVTPSQIEQPIDSLIDRQLMCVRI